MDYKMEFSGRVWDFWMTDNDEKFFVIIELDNCKELEKHSNLILIEADLLW